MKLALLTATANDAEHAETASWRRCARTMDFIARRLRRYLAAYGASDGIGKAPYTLNVCGVVRLFIVLVF